MKIVAQLFPHWMSTKASPFIFRFVVSNIVLNNTILCSIISSDKHRSKKCRTIEADRDEIKFVPSYTSPPFILIYTTKANYDSLIPIGLNESKTQIVSYPAPSDIKSIYGFPTPIRLEDNYLLDKRGINKNTVFLDISYSEYAKYEKSPDTDTLMKHIIDYNPFTEIWNCDSKYSYSDAVSQINQIIKAKKMNIFRKIM